MKGLAKIMNHKYTLYIMYLLVTMNGLNYLRSNNPYCLLALGGIGNTDENYIQAIQSGGHGIAGITKFWNKF